MKLVNPSRIKKSISFFSLFGAFFAVAQILTCHHLWAIAPISQSYSSETKLSSGTIVSLKANTEDEVVASSNSNAENILGIVINSDSSPITLSNGKENQVQVATNGTMSVYVSDINGQIARGDQITASPIAGVGMKATSNVRVVGIAQGEPTSTKQTSYKDTSGNSHSVTIGEIPILINVSYFFKEPDKTIIPSAIQNVANALAGKQVGTLPILISLAIFIITIVVVVSIIFSMVKSSIISVGRNPMSQSAIYRDLVQLSALVLVILGVGMASIYLVLTRM